MQPPLVHQLRRRSPLPLTRRRTNRPSLLVISRAPAIALLLSLTGLSLSGQAVQATNSAAPPLPESPDSILPSAKLTPSSPSSVAPKAATPLTQTLPAPSATETLTPIPETAAPSVLWLIAMPAVPIVGGALIYLSRRLLGNQQRECRLIAHVPPPHSSSPADQTPSPDSEQS